jgi:23S rRNA (cytidine1920-2'-O)/16S rRNA (cytidine1409-2'-O)-methyltransferase
MKKVRIDKVLVDIGLAPSRAKAVALIMAGCVLVDDVPVQKAGQTVDPEADIRLRGKDHPYVSRGGLKLERAMKEFGIDAARKTCMDLGASTGGFTDYLLQNGASLVYAIDVGYGQLAMKLLQDDRVVVIERTNVRYLTEDHVPEQVDLVVMDLSFISLELIFPAIEPFIGSGAQIVALIKPQFEVGRDLVGKGGIVRDPDSRELAIAKVRQAGEALGWIVEGVTESPIKGAKGNVEFLICFKKG